jgi:type II secretory pathway pseudopilin PulG
MNAAPAATDHRQGGWTLIELIAGAALTSLIVLAALTLTDTSRTGASAARDIASHTAWLRRAASQLREDLTQSTTTRFLVTKAGGQNDVVTLQRPLPTGGWGAWQPAGDAAQRLLPDHTIRYRVTNDGSDRVLRREVVDTGGDVVGELILARGLATGSSTPAGLRVDPAGDMWRVTIGLLAVGNRAPESLTFDVALKN